MYYKVSVEQIAENKEDSDLTIYEQLFRAEDTDFLKDIVIQLNQKTKKV